MKEMEEDTPLLEQTPHDEEERQQASPYLKKLKDIFERVLDWSPFIAVSSVGGSGSNSTSFAFLIGTIAAVFVIFYWYLMTDKEKTYKPKLLDVGQFLLFGSLYALALLANHAGKYTSYLQELLFLWFNPLTTGGLALIMWTSVINGRPFVYDYVEAQVPPFIYELLMSKKWFRDKLTEVAMFWVKTLTAMTIIVAIQPFLVTIFYQGDPNNDLSGFMNFLGFWLTVGQFVILFSAMRYSAKMQRADGEKSKRVRHVKLNGFTEEEKKLYGDAVVVSSLDAKNHYIQSLKSSDEKQLNSAANVLADAFQDDGMVNALINTKDARLRFFKANVKAYSVFNHVFACYDKSLHAKYPDRKLRPQCVMVCVPVYSKRHEEIDVFGSFQAWVEYGFMVGASKTDIPIPDDELMEVGELKKKKEHGLTTKPFLYIAYFGSDPSYKGQGYGKSLLKYVVDLSEKKQVPLVLETGTLTNRKNYEKYGFKVVDRVKARNDWVLMIRPVEGRNNGYGSV